MFASPLSIACHENTFVPSVELLILNLRDGLWYNRSFGLIVGRKFFQYQDIRERFLFACYGYVQNSF